MSGSSLCLDHYLDQLMRKPGALWDCQAVQRHQFAPELLQVWQRLEQRYPERDANRKFIDILCLGRRHGSNYLIAAAREALPLGTVEPEAIENILCSMVSAAPEVSEGSLRHRLEHVPFDSWTCDVDQYSQLNGGTQV